MEQTVDAILMFNQYAEEIKLDQGIFDSCLSNEKYIDEIKKDLKDGQDYGVSGTPGFFFRGNEEIEFVELKGASAI